MLINGIVGAPRSIAEKSADERFGAGFFAGQKRRKLSKYELQRSNIAQQNRQFRKNWERF
jgi:hypothetical protein